MTTWAEAIRAIRAATDEHNELVELLAVAVAERDDLAKQVAELHLLVANALVDAQGLT